MTRTSVFGILLLSRGIRAGGMGTLFSMEAKTIVPHSAGFRTNEAMC
jgi:hypothetical protein